MLPTSTIGKKIVVAITGLALFGFVIGHLAGNLQIFLGPTAINDYSANLHNWPRSLWLARAGLLLAVLLHVILTIQLTSANRAARPIGYHEFHTNRSSVASRTMFWGGLVIFFYIIYHLLHMTTGTVHPHFSKNDVYGNLISGLSVWYVALFYVIANIALGFHLYHGVWSVFQTLGLNHPKYNPWRRCLATLAACGIAIGYISIPVAIYLGIVR